MGGGPIFHSGPFHEGKVRAIVQIKRFIIVWALIRILYLDTARFIDLLYVRSHF